MAHVKVVRRSMRPDDYIRMRYAWLRRLKYRNMTEIEGIQIRDARLVSENEYEYYGDYYSLKKGDLYYTPDGSAFIRASFTVPEELKNERVFLYCRTASEMIVKINGKFAGGIDPNRQAIDITDYLFNGTGEISITGFNRSKPDDERNPEVMAIRGCRQVFEGMFLCNENPAVISLCYDLEALIDIMDSDCFDEDYRTEIINELDAALDLIDFDDFDIDAVVSAGEYIENHIYANKTWKGRGEVYLVGHSHLDLAYYWQRKHTIDKNLRTVLIQLRLMEKYPDYCYAHTQAYTYETLEKYYPEVFEELKERIEEGRFEPVGAMYVEPDCNIPSAESLIRQCLYGQNYFREKFGITVNTAFLPDVFGNSWILPQILKKSGVDCFISNKMSTWNDTNRFPHNNFIWRGIDGTDIYACVPPTHFITWNEPSQVVENYDAYQDKHSSSNTLSMFGYGDGGSGPTEEMIELMHRFRKLSVMPETKHGTVKDFISENFTPEKKLEVWDGELYLEMHRGTFTTKHDIKRANRQLEEKFRQAEMLAVARKKDTRTLRELYKLFLINQFHDILPGSHITPVYKDAMRDYTEIEKGLDEYFPKGKKAFNLLNSERDEVEFIPDENGKTVRCGVKGNYKKISAAALGEININDSDSGSLSFENGVVDTPFYLISLADDGSFSSFWDKELGREWVGTGAINRLRLFDDRPGNYDAWDILPDYEDREFEFTAEGKPVVTLNDGNCLEIVCTVKTEKSRWERVIRFFSASRAIEVENRVDWNEKHRLAKVFFEPEILTRKVICDTSAGWIERELHRNTSWQQARFECCTHKWFDIPETSCGLAVINDGKYGIGLHPTGVSLSLLRATERPDPTSDLGHHEFVYRIIPHAGDFISAEINKKALAFNSPLVFADEISLPAILGEFSPLYLEAVKTAENGDGIIIRLAETDGRRGSIALFSRVTVTNLLEDALYETDTIDFRPFEIITLKINTER